MANGTVTLTKGEFDKFWAEVLGPDWYIEEWDVNDLEYEQADPDHYLVIGVLAVAWQGRGEPTTNGYLTPSRLASWNHLAALRSWLSGQELRRFSAWIPREAVKDFQNFVTRVGGYESLPGDVR